MRKQMIEEMAKSCCDWTVNCQKWSLLSHCNYIYHATKIYNAGYRKIPENAVVLTREEAETISGTLKAYEEFIFDLQEATMVCKKEIEEAQKVAVKEIEEYVQQARKETAEKFAERMKAQYPPRTDKRCTLDDCYMLDRIDEICKEISEGTEDVKNE